MTSSGNGSMEVVARLDDIPDQGFKVVTPQQRPILLVRDGRKVFALDNRCPHMGFPLSQGTYRHGIVTCHWHHARFEAEGGCAFDLFADDAPAYAVEVTADDDVRLTRTPRRLPGPDYYRQRLEQGLQQNVTMMISKCIIGMLAVGGHPVDLVRTIAQFGSRHHDGWRDGMTFLALATRLWDLLSDNTRILLLAKAAHRVAANCADQPARRERGELLHTTVDFPRLQAWFQQWIRSRHRDGAERTLMTAIAGGADRHQLDRLLFGAIGERIYADTGHLVDFTNKALELVEFLGGDAAHDLLPLLMREAAESVGEEDRGGWRTPVDLVAIATTARARLDETPPIDPPRDAKALRAALLGEDPAGLIDCLLPWLSAPAAADTAAREIAYAAARRLAQFPESNDVADWFDPVHTLNFAHAAGEAVRHSPGRETNGLLIDAALSVYQDRFLNIPAAPLPDPDAATVARCPDDPTEARRITLAGLDQKQPWHHFTSAIVVLLRRHGPKIAIDTLAQAALQEDVDFHKIQSVEAAAWEALHWSGQPEAEHILAGAARHLAAHAPTPRSQAKLIRIAQRLRSGEALHEADEAAEA